MLTDPTVMMARYSKIAAIAIGGFGFFVAAGGFASTLSGAVLAPGIVVVESSLRKVQHGTGGVVGKLLVVEGQRVTQGELLVRLDDTMTRANLQIVMNELQALTARRARLQAERDGDTDVTFPENFVAQAKDDPELARLMSGERQLFLARRATQIGRKAQLKERIDQTKEEVVGLDMQLRSLSAQSKVAREELKDLEVLMAKNLIQRPRITQLQREVIRLDGAIGETTSKKAQIRGKVAEVELALLQVDTDQIAEVAKELREVETKVGELSERRVAAEDQLAKVEIRAPITGQVHQLAVHTVGGVISPSETIMMVVPDNDRLIVEARVSPNDIDEIKLGQLTRIRFSSFSSATTPELEGQVVRIAGDLTREPQTGLVYYTVAVQISPEQLSRLGALKLMPGMPAEAYLKTADRTIASFIVKLLIDHFNRSLRES